MTTLHDYPAIISTAMLPAQAFGLQNRRNLAPIVSMLIADNILPLQCIAEINLFMAEAFDGIEAKFFHAKQLVCNGFGQTSDKFVEIL
jgi:hypothetical protein